MSPRRKKDWEGWESFISSAVEAEGTIPHSCADFRRKWTPTEFCNLSLSERRVMLQALLTNSDPIFIVQEEGGYNFATGNSPIYEAMPLLYDQKTNGQIAREACEAFYQNNTFILSSRWLRHIVEDQKDTWIQRETIQPSLLFRSLRILLDNYEPQTPGATLSELTNLFTCTHLDHLEIEICTPQTLANDPEGRKHWSLSAATAIGAMVRRLMEKFGTAVKVLVGGPFATQGKEYITWMYTF